MSGPSSLRIEGYQGPEGFIGISGSGIVSYIHFSTSSKYNPCVIFIKEFIQKHIKFQIIIEICNNFGLIDLTKRVTELSICKREILRGNFTLISILNHYGISFQDFQPQLEYISFLSEVNFKVKTKVFHKYGLFRCWRYNFSNCFRYCELNFINDKRDGMFKLFDSLGDKYIECEYKNERRNGFSRHYLCNKVIDEKFYRNNLLMSKKMWNKNGKLTYHIEHVDQKPATGVYYPNGSMEEGRRPFVKYV